MPPSVDELYLESVPQRAPPGPNTECGTFMSLSRSLVRLTTSSVLIRSTSSSMAYERWAPLTCRAKTRERRLAPRRSPPRDKRREGTSAALTSESSQIALSSKVAIFLPCRCWGPRSTTSAIALHAHARSIIAAWDDVILATGTRPCMATTPTLLCIGAARRCRPTVDVPKRYNAGALSPCACHVRSFGLRGVDVHELNLVLHTGLSA